MKPDPSALERALLAAAAKMGLELPVEAVSKMGQFSQIVLAANRRLNLTRIVQPRDMAVKHFIDSLSLLLLGLPQKLSVLDVGSGAGFPGVPLAIMEKGWSFLLLDSLRKRVQFLLGVQEELGLENLAVYHGRAEELGRLEEHRGRYDLVISRAVAPLPVLLELCSPLVEDGGRFVAYKGVEGQRELQDSKVALAQLKMGHEQTFPLDLPWEMGRRNLLLFRKIGPTPPRYPRRPGIPAKKPLV